MFTEIVHVLDRLRPELGNNVVDALRDAFAVCNQYLRHRGPMQLITSFSDFNLVDVTLQSQELQAGLEVQNPAGFIDDDNILHDGAAAHFIGPVIIHAGDAIPAAAAGDDFGGGGGGASDVQPLILYVTGTTATSNLFLMPGRDGADGDGGWIQFPGAIAGVPQGGFQQNPFIIKVPVHFEPGASLLDTNEEQLLWTLIDGYASCTVATVGCDGTHEFIPKYYLQGPYGGGLEFLIDVWTTIGATHSTNEAGQLGNVTLTDTSTQRGTGKVGTNSLDFNGTDDYVKYDNSEMNLGNDWSIGMWFKPHDIGSANHQDLMGDTYSGLQMGINTSDKPYISVNDGSDTTTLTLDEALTQDVWHFLTARYDSDSDTIFLDVCAADEPWDDRQNGHVENTGTGIYFGSDDMYIGCSWNETLTSHSQFEFNGEVDGIVLSGAVFGDSDMEWLFNSGDGRAYA